MKNLNVKSVIIGFLSCAVIVLVFGFKSAEIETKPAGTYQAFVGPEGALKMLNTSTGEVYTTNKIQVIKYKWRNVSSKELFKGE